MSYLFLIVMVTTDNTQHTTDNARGMTYHMIYGQCLHAVLAGVLDYHKKNFVPNSGPNFEGASYKLYSSVTYTRINTVLGQI